MNAIKIFFLFLCFSLSKVFAQNIIQLKNTTFIGGERFEVNFEMDNEEQERIAQSTAITTPTIMPANPTTADTVRAKYKMSFPSQPAFQLSVTTVSISDSVVTIEEHYAPGTATSPTIVVKTTDIGKLPAGDYKLICNLHKYNLTTWESPTSYTYTEYGIDKDSVLFTVTGSTLSIAENGTDLLQHLSMRPNPAVNQFIISSDKSIDDLQIHIVNLTGNILLSTTCKSNCEIDISQLAQGLYFVNIYQREKFVGVKKLVVMR